MRAARLHAPRRGADPADLRIEAVEDPVPDPGEVLVRIGACGVCASDLHLLQGSTPAGPLPLTIGHEAAGEVADVGGAVEGWLPGDRVALLMGRPCRSCGYCRAARENLCPELVIPGIDVDGSQAEFAVTRPAALVPLPGGIPFEVGAILTDAVATPYHALKRGGVGEDMVVAVFGLGGLGLHAVQLAKLAGADVIGVDIDPVALERAPSWGADEVVDGSDGSPHRAIQRLGGADTSFEFVGAVETARQAVKALKAGGRATLVGLTPERLELLPSALLVRNELEVVGSFGSTAADLNELIDLVEAGRLDLTRSVTHELDPDELPAALDWLEHRDDEHPIRSVVTYG